MLAESTATSPGRNFPGGADPIVMMQTLATAAGLNFSNSGASGQNLTDHTLTGSIKDQIQQVAEAANINYVVENGTLFVWPAGGIRPGFPPPLISATTGMIDYPAPSGDGWLEVKTLFSHALAFGATFDIESELLHGRQTWQVAHLVHDLEVETPGGAWMTTVAAVGLIDGKPIIQQPL